MAQAFEQRFTYLVRRVSNELAQHVDRALRDFALTHSQFGALTQLSLVCPEALSAATMAERNGVTAQSMSTAVAGLLTRGLVDREPHPTHGRILQVRITPEGAKLLAEAQKAVHQAEDRALSALDQDRLREAERLLRAIMRELGLYLYLPDDA